MKFLKSFTRTRFRQTFFSFYILSSLLPLLFLVWVLGEYVFPVLEPGQSARLRMVFAYALAVMLLAPLLGFFLMRWWISSLEALTRDVEHFTAEIIPEQQEAAADQEENEMMVLRQHFEGLYNELQDKISQLNNYSQRLIEDNIKLSAQVTKDELTTLYNRRHFNERLQEEVVRAQRHGHNLSLIMIDADNFKRFNDEYGHPAGDRLLRNLGTVIKTTIRKSDVPFRYGGDEFVIILPQCNVRDAAIVAQKLVKAVAANQAEDAEYAQADWFSISCGVAELSEGAERLISEADKCLYMAKSKGPGQVIFVKPRAEKKSA